MYVIAFPCINPVAASFGPLQIRWYALAYVFGIILASVYAKKISSKFNFSITSEHIEGFISPAILGIIIGGRLGYVFFYDPFKYLSNPIEILKVYTGGLSFHGGIAGLLIALYFYCKNKNINFLNFTDLLAIIAPIGLFLGRLANFINAELYGTITDAPWGIIFPGSDGNVRHPSQIYEAICEGLLIFIFINYITFKFKTLDKSGFNSGVFGILYAISRIFIENFREPDFIITFLGFSLTPGQILSFPMLLIGIYLLTINLSSKK